MAEPVNREGVIRFLERVGDVCAADSDVMLLGGAALVLLGGARPTVDIDYVGSDLHLTDLQQLINTIADEMRLDVEAVPVEEFVPALVGAAERAIPVEQFGNLRVSILDPYTIALTKLARGFDSDIEDILFLVRRGWVEVGLLVGMVEDASAVAESYEVDAADLQKHLQVVQNRLQS